MQTAAETSGLGHKFQFVVQRGGRDAFARADEARFVSARKVRVETLIERSVKGERLFQSAAVLCGGDARHEQRGEHCGVDGFHVVR